MSISQSASVDLDALEKTTRSGVRFLDNVLSWNRSHHQLLDVA
jgi:hypothetical protein